MTTTVKTLLGAACLLAVAACSIPPKSVRNELEKIDVQTTPASDVRFMTEMPLGVIPAPEKGLTLTLQVDKVVQKYRLVTKTKEQKQLRTQTGKHLFVFGFSNADARAFDQLRQATTTMKDSKIDLDGGACYLGAQAPHTPKGTLWIKTAELRAYTPLTPNFRIRGDRQRRLPPCPAGALDSWVTE